MLILMFKTYSILPKRESSPKHLMEMIKFVSNYMKDMGHKVLVPFIKIESE